MTAFIAALLPLGLMLLMFVVGLRLSLRGLAQTFAQPRALAIGLVVQMVLLPIAAVLLARLFALPGPMALGLVLVAAAPGGVTSNYIAHLIRADLALSAAMTLSTTLVAALSLPLVLNLSGGQPLPDMSGLVGISLAMAGVALAPMVAGMALTWWRPKQSARLTHLLEPISKVIFAAMVIATFAQNWPAMRSHFTIVGPAVLALNLTALALSAGAGMAFRLGQKKTRAIMVEASLQNVAIALFVATSLLDDPQLTIPALIFALVMNVTALGHITFTRFSPRKAHSAMM